MGIWGFPAVIWYVLLAHSTVWYLLLSSNNLLSCPVHRQLEASALLLRVSWLKGCIFNGTFAFQSYTSWHMGLLSHTTSSYWCCGHTNSVVSLHFTQCARYFPKYFLNHILKKKKKKKVDFIVVEVQEQYSPIQCSHQNCTSSFSFPFQLEEQKIKIMN